MGRDDVRLTPNSAAAGRFLMGRNINTSWAAISIPPCHGLACLVERLIVESATRQHLARAVEELKIHAIMEEEIFYPAVRARVGGKLMNEVDEEHHVVEDPCRGRQRSKARSSRREIHATFRKRSPSYLRIRNPNVPTPRESMWTLTRWERPCWPAKLMPRRMEFPPTRSTA